MAMSEFEKKLIAELKGIKDELRKLNKQGKGHERDVEVPMQNFRPIMSNLLEEA